MVTWVLQQGSFPAGCGFSLLFSLLLGLLSEWEGLFHVSIYHTSFFFLSSLPGVSAAYLPWELNIPAAGAPDL